MLGYLFIGHPGCFTRPSRSRVENINTLDVSPIFQPISNWRNWVRLGWVDLANFLSIFSYFIQSRIHVFTWNAVLDMQSYYRLVFVVWIWIVIEGQNTYPCWNAHIHDFWALNRRNSVRFIALLVFFRKLRWFLIWTSELPLAILKNGLETELTLPAKLILLVRAFIIREINHFRKDG